MPERVRLEGINTSKGMQQKDKKQKRNKAPGPRPLDISMQVYKMGCLKGAGEVNLMDLTVKTEQSWNKKTFSLYNGNWGQLLPPKLRAAFNQVFKSFDTT